MPAQQQARVYHETALEQTTAAVDETLECDVVVVGAGPGGSLAAKRAAEEGARTLLIEQRTTIGSPVQCAEYLPLVAARFAPMQAPWIAQRIDGMISHYPDGSTQETRAPGYIMNRVLYDRGLAAMAEKAGAEIRTRTSAEAVSDEGILVRQGASTINVACTAVVGADGPDSTVASWTAQKNRSIMTAHQYEVGLKAPSTMTEVWFDRHYPRGYAWLFPKGDTANVGVGVSPADAAKPALEHFYERLRVEGRIGSILGTTAGRIPVGGPLETIKGNLLLVGDAAGQTHPITGAGIYHALLAGSIAGRACGEAARTGDFGCLDLYDAGWQKELKPTLDRGVRRREVLEKHWDEAAKDEESLTTLIRKTWVVCPEYYDDREARFP